MKLGVSRSSLREAVRALTALGVLDARQGDGTYVTSLEPYLLLQGTRFVVELLEKETLLELLMVRRLLEPGATALAAARISDFDLSRMRECLRRMDSASTQEELVEADDEFHSIIVNASGRPTLAALVKASPAERSGHVYGVGSRTKRQWNRIGARTIRFTEPSIGRIPSSPTRRPPNTSPRSSHGSRASLRVAVALPK